MIGKENKELELDMKMKKIIFSKLKVAQQQI